MADESKETKEVGMYISKTISLFIYPLFPLRNLRHDPAIELAHDPTLRALAAIHNAQHTVKEPTLIIFTV